MPAMTMTNQVYQAREQAAHMTGAAKNIILEDTFSRSIAELQEDAEDAARAEKAWNEFEKSGETAIPAEVLYKELGL